MTAPSGMRIRPFEPADEEPVVALWQACGLTRPWNDPHKDIARKLTEQPELFLVAEERVVGAKDGRISAVAMAGFEGHRGWINYLAVDPERQGAGIGRELVEHVEALLLARGCPKVSVQVREGNDDALAFYRALGFDPDRSVSLGKRLIEDGPR